MRKLLLATAALMSGSMGVVQIASAQSTPAPLPSLGAGLTMNVGVAPVPTPYGGAGAPFTATPSPTAPPGTITVRINARINFYVAAGSDSGRNASAVTTSASASGTTVTSPNSKLANYSFLDYARLYPAFDGIAANGLKYGGLIEVREDNGEPAGGGVNGGVSQGSRNQGTLYTRVAYLYLGSDRAGFLRFGTTYGAATLHITGTFENYNDGAWNGDIGAVFTGNTTPTWPFPDVGAIYATQKVVYVSPQFFGLDFAASFEPNTSAGGDNNGNCSYNNTVAGSVTGPIGTGAGSSCYATSSTTVAGETARRRNTGEASIRYRGSFGPAGIAANVAVIGGSKVINDNSPAVKATQVQYDGLELVDAGGIFTFGGLAVGGNVIGGRGNGQFSLDPKGMRDEFAYMVGTSYAVGPFIVGGSFFDYMSTGSKTAFTSPWVGNRDEYGVAAGGTYNFAPGMNVFLSYLYGHRKENGVDLLTGTLSSGSSRSGLVLTHNNVQSQGFGIGTQFRW